MKPEQRARRLILINYCRICSAQKCQFQIKLFLFATDVFIIFSWNSGAIERWVQADTLQVIPSFRAEK